MEDWEDARTGYKWADFGCALKTPGRFPDGNGCGSQTESRSRIRASAPGNMGVPVPEGGMGLGGLGVRVGTFRVWS